MGRWDTRMKMATTATVIAVLVAGLCAASVAAATPSLTFGQVAVNQTTKFSGNGFDANEPLAFWVTAPDRSVTPLVGDQADAAGAFGVTVSFSTDGFWQVTAHGTTTKKEIIGGFKVGNATTTTGAGSTAAVASATAIAPNQRVTFVRDGFRPLESVSLWATGPDGMVTPLDGTSAEVSGIVNVPVTFPGSGFWQVTAHGTTSGNEAIVGYSVGDAITVANITPAPTSAATVRLATSVAAFPTSTTIAATPLPSSTTLGNPQTRPTSRVGTGSVVR